MSVLYAATNNSHKLKEISDILKKDFLITSPLKENININPEENGNTFLENAKIKAKAHYTAIAEKYPVIADDSGLCIDFLGGKPGVYSARYGGDITDKERCIKILKELENLPLEKRSAKFICCVCYISSDIEFSVLGELKGYIGESMSGENGFGYDPIFYLPNGRSLAKLSEEEKNSISHRKNALENFYENYKNTQKRKNS